MGVCDSLPIAICPISISEDIRENGDVVDLLICIIYKLFLFSLKKIKKKKAMCFSAVTSNRRDDIFEPFPPEFLKEKFRDYKSLENVLHLIPAVKGKFFF